MGPQLGGFILLMELIDGLKKINKVGLLLQERRLWHSHPVGQASQGLISEPLEPLVYRRALRHLHRAPHGPRR